MSWNYAVLDDFLKKEHADYCLQFLDQIELTDQEMYTKKMVFDRKTKETKGFTLLSFDKNRKKPDIKKFEPKEDFLDLTQVFTEIMNDKIEVLKNLLHILNPGKIKTVDGISLQLSKIGKTFHYEKHNDIPWKILSTVTYLGEKNNGTNLYNDRSNENPDESVVWKHNRCLIFSRNENTWHDFKADGNSARSTLIINLVDSSHPI